MARNVYKCCNYGQCGCDFETTFERDLHEQFCTYEPPPPPPEPERQPKAG